MNIENMSWAELQSNNEFMDLFELTGSEDEAGAVARSEFAVALKGPLNKELPVMNYARTFLDIEILDPQAQATYFYDNDPIDAWFLPRIGSAPQNLVGVTEVYIPTDRITSSVEWDIELPRQRRFGAVKRQGLKLLNSVVRKENEAFWTLLDGAMELKPEISVDGEGSLTKAVLNAGFTEMESQGEDYSVKYVLINPRHVGDIRNWDSKDLDPVTRREIWKDAGLGNIWGADVIIDRTGKVGLDEIYLFAEGLGAMPIKSEFVTFDDPSAIRQFRQRVLGFEEVGMGILDNKSVVKIKIN